MPASRRSSAKEYGATVAQVDAACRQVVAGKLAMRELTSWVCELGVTESEFRLLWRLEFGVVGASDAGTSRHERLPDQAQLAEQLALSPAQLSGMVERLSAAGLIAPELTPRDRRRQAWRMAPAGRQLISKVVARVAPPRVPAVTAKEAA
jgi:DNA-binding MarR family transcriptional regulator